LKISKNIIHTQQQIEGVILYAVNSVFSCFICKQTCVVRQKLNNAELVGVTGDIVLDESVA